jgi:acetyltransferase-like isoleucine patch superfamily enzyme
MMNLFKALNRGLIFRANLALQNWRQRRHFERWRRGVNSFANIEQDVLITGHPKGWSWIEIGAGAEIQRHCRIWIGEKDLDEPRLKIGKRVFIGQGTHLSVMWPMEIGDNTLVGAYCYLLTNQHRFESRAIPIFDQGYDCKPLFVREGVWIGAHCVIMPGVTIGKGAIVGAGSVLTKDVGEYEIWAGVPAKKIGIRP